MKKLIFFAVVIFIPGFAATNSDMSGSYQINNFGEKFLITPNVKDDLTLCAHMHKNYSIILPSHKGWKFYNNKSYSIFASNDSVNYSLEVFESDNKNDKLYLNNLKEENLRNKSRNGVINAQLTLFMDTIILKITVDVYSVTKKPELKGVKQYHYYSAVVSNGFRYKSHYSIIVSKGVNNNDFDETIKKHLTYGLIFNK